MPASTLRSWVFGSTTFEPVIDAHDKRHRWRLSYVNLAEAHVLSSMRRIYEHKMGEVRSAIADLRGRFERPLFEAAWRTDTKRLFVERLGRSIEASGAPQLVFAEIEMNLSRIEWKGLLFAPFPRGLTTEELLRADPPRPVSISPMVQYGHPVIRGTNVPTISVADRYFANEPPEQIARDFDITVEQVEAAAEWEKPRALVA